MTDHYYIHIPFCRQKCPYCKFALTPVFDEFKKKRYIEYLKKEITTYFKGHQSLSSEGLCGKTVSGVPIFTGESGKSVSEKGKQAVDLPGFGERNSLSQIESNTEIAKCTSFSLPNAFDTFGSKSIGNSVRDTYEDLKTNSGGRKTIYFGGGTPSILSHEEIREILDCFPFYRKNETEITLESNPEDINREYIEGILQLGINRISVGVQTLNNQSLQEIHRSDKERILEALENIGIAIISSGGEKISVNIDFILGLPYTQPGETLSSIEELHRRFPYITHTSVYMLEDENYPKHWKNYSITEDEMQTEFLAIIEYFESIGWHHYELSNWARPGYESIHNQAYWNHSDSIGFGLSAASYSSDRRWSNSSSFSGYYQGKIEHEETLTNEQKEIEKMMFGLRTSRGLTPLPLLRHNSPLESGGLETLSGGLGNPGKLQKLISDGLLEIQNHTIKPTKTGIFVIDHIMGELLS